MLLLLLLLLLQDLVPMVVVVMVVEVVPVVLLLLQGVGRMQESRERATQGYEGSLEVDEHLLPDLKAAGVVSCADMIGVLAAGHAGAACRIHGCSRLAPCDGMR
jgi:hypothetical protein